MSDETHEHNHEPLSENVTITKEKGSTVVVAGDIPVSVVDAHRAKAIKRLGRNLNVPGFRKGHVPDALIIDRFGEQAILEEIAELVLSHAYGDIIMHEKLDVIGRPQVTLTKIALGNPIGFKITASVYPEVTLPDYKKIAAGVIGKHDDPEKVELGEQEVALEMERIRGIIAQQGGRRATEAGATSPELTDELVRTLGDFKDLADFEARLRSQLLGEKIRKEIEKRRLAIVDAILEKTKMEVPDIFVQDELDKMMSEFRDNVTRMGMKVEDYLIQVKKTVDDLRNDWQPDALKRAKLQLVVAEIAKKEHITPNEQALEKEVAHITEHYSGAREENVRSYVTMMMTTDLVFALLEGRTDAAEQLATSSAAVPAEDTN